MILTILSIFIFFIVGVLSGIKFQSIMAEKKLKSESLKYSIDKNNQFSEVLSNIKFGISEFKSRVNDTVYITSKLSEFGDIDVVYLLDKSDIAIFQGTKCIHTSDGVSVDIIDDIISAICKKHEKKIDDFVEFFGFKFNREDFERSFNIKIEDFKNGILFSGMVPSNNESDKNEIDRINFENKKKFNIDDILDKISLSGIDSLTFEEIIFLDSYSK